MIQIVIFVQIMSVLRGKKILTIINLLCLANDFSALMENTPSPHLNPVILYLKCRRQEEKARSFAFHQIHSKTLPLLSIEEIIDIVHVWQAQLAELSQKYLWVQIFENKGAAMGCSNPRPSWSNLGNSFLPNEVAKADQSQRNYFRSMVQFCYLIMYRRNLS